MGKPYLKKLCTNIYLVDGFYIRNHYDVDFVAGGHWLRYKFIPGGEIWIEDTVKPRERKFIILHEKTEVGLMQRGFTYNQAHKSANKIEVRARG